MSTWSGGVAQVRVSTRERVIVVVAFEVRSNRVAFGSGTNMVHSRRAFFVVILRERNAWWWPARKWGRWWWWWWRWKRGWRRWNGASVTPGARVPRRGNGCRRINILAYALGAVVQRRRRRRRRWKRPVSVRVSTIHTPKTGFYRDGDSRELVRVGVRSVAIINKTW